MDLNSVNKIPHIHNVSVPLNNNKVIQIREYTDHEKRLVKKWLKKNEVKKCTIKN